MYEKILLSKYKTRQKNMEIFTRKEGQALIFSPKGRLDAITTPEFESAVISAVDGGDIRILIDMGNIEYISSAGLRSFVVLMKKLKQLNGRLVLFALQKQVMEVFAVCGFSSIITIKDTQQEALGQV